MEDVHWVDLQHTPHGSSKLLGFLGILGRSLSGSEESSPAAQLGRDFCGGLKLTHGNSWLPRSYLAGPSEDLSDDPKVLDCLGKLGWALPGSKQSTMAAQLSRVHCGGLQLTCSGSKLP